MRNGQMWFDIHNQPIQAHGGCIIKYEDTYYWYGENKGQDNVPGTKRVDVIGISCYSSKNLVDWKYEGLVLEAEKEDIDSKLYYKNVLERPKVIYNEKTGKFVMWMHVDDARYLRAETGVAVSDSPTGPFCFKGAFRPNGRESRDMTIYKDRDGTAYLIHSSDANCTMYIARLTEDYTNVDGFFVPAMEEQQREAPAVCKHGDKYFMVTSGCTGWYCNSALFSTSDYVQGIWRLIDNPCEGENYRKTFFGQSTYIFEIDNQKFLMLDHWEPDDLKNSGYSILPIEFNDDNTMTIRWKEEWNGEETCLRNT